MSMRGLAMRDVAMPRTRRWRARALAGAVAGFGVAVAWLLAGRAAYADDAGADVTATVDARPAVATVGDRIGFRFRVSHPPGWTVVWPDLGKAWGPFEVVSVGPSLVSAGEGPDDVPPGAVRGGPATAMVTDTRIVTATAFTTGTLATPAMTLTAVDPAGIAHRVDVAGARVAIRSVLGAQDQAPRAARGPVELPMPSLWPLVAGALATVAALLALLGWAVRRMWARRAPVEAVAAPAWDFRTPLDHALAALDALDRADLPARGRVIDHYTRLADALRAFVEGAFHLPAQERTTRELAHAFGPLAERDAEVGPLLAVLGDADLVKFAGIVPDAATAHASLADAKALVGPLWGAAERRRIAAEAAAASAASAAAADDDADADEDAAADGDDEAAA